MDWKDFHDQAIRLSISPIESDQRSAISRAYYALYNLSKERFLLYDGIIGHQDQGSHSSLWNSIRGDNDENWRFVGLMGSRLKIHRVSADYYKAFRGNLNTVTGQAIRQSQACIQRLNDFFPEK